MYAENKTLAVIQALQKSTELLEEAISAHIYDFDSGEKVDPSCQYHAQVAENKRLLGET